MEENIHKDHRKRVRKKFLKSKFVGFDDHQKLELLLFYTIPIKDTNPIAHKLLKKFKTIGGVFDATVEQLKEVDGIGENSAILLKLIPELAKEYTLSKYIHVDLKNPEAACEFFRTQFAGEIKEKVKIAALDDKLRLKCCEELAEGSLNAVSIDIKKIITFAQVNNSNNIIIAHNHPNGDHIPSNEDLTFTKTLLKNLNILGIQLIDHIIVAKGQTTSLKSVGALNLL